MSARMCDYLYTHPYIIVKRIDSSDSCWYVCTADAWCCADVEGTIGVMDKYELMEQDDIGATLASANKQQAKL